MPNSWGFGDSGRPEVQGRLFCDKLIEKLTYRHFCDITLLKLQMKQNPNRPKDTKDLKT